MKAARITTLAAALLLCISVAACGTVQETQTGNGKAKSIFLNSETNVKISMGMTRSEVETQLQRREEQAPILDSATQEYGTTPEDTLTVYYDQGIVRGISVDSLLDPEKTSHWSLAGGVTKGSTLENIQKYYGRNTDIVEENGIKTLTYSYDSDGNVTEDPQNINFVVAFCVGDDGLKEYAVSSGVLLSSLHPTADGET